MGMYDYLGGEQIKIFYVPIFNNGEIWHSGGRLRSFDIGDELPLKTLYYQYPDNFLVYDFRFEDEEVWIIKDKALHKIVGYKELEEKDIIGPVYDYFGRELNIYMTGDFNRIKFEAKKAREEDKKAEKELFPNGVIHTLKNNMEEYKEKEEEWKKIQYLAINGFSKKWFKENLFQKEKDFGEAIECYLCQLKMDPEDKECENYLTKLINENPSIIKKYQKWINNEEMLKEINFDKIIKKTH